MIASESEQIWEQDLGGRWIRKYEQLKEYVQEEGKLPTQYDKNEEPKFLGNWCRKQRRNYKKGKLSEEQIQMLEQIPGWYWEQWIQKYDQLKEYVQEEGKLPSKTDKNEEAKSLKSWCNTQRKNYKKSELSGKQIQILEQIPSWYWEQDLEEQWVQRYEQLREYVQKEGKLASKTEKNEESKSLGKWCSKQRQNYRKNKLSNKKIQTLEQIPGWYWN